MMQTVRPAVIIVDTVAIRVSLLHRKALRSCSIFAHQEIYIVAKMASGNQRHTSDFAACDPVSPFIPARADIVEIVRC